jgi:tetratricopeptide (TPR) repeat protein
MSCGCELALLHLLFASLAQSGTPRGVPRFVLLPRDSVERADRRFPMWSGRIADVRPFPLFDEMNEPEKGNLRADVDFNGIPDLVEFSRFGRVRLRLQADSFAESPLLEGREIVCATRFVSFADLDGDGRPELFIAAPADPIGDSVLASNPPWLSGLALRVQRDAASFVSGGVVIACSKDGRRDVTDSLGLARLPPFRAGAVADVDGDGAPEILLFGGESDDMRAFWDDVVPTFGRVGADPVAAAAAMASLAPPKRPDAAPRVLKRRADGRFAPVAAEFPDEIANMDVVLAAAIDQKVNQAPDLLLVTGDGERRRLHNTTTDSAMTTTTGRRPELVGFAIHSAVRTPAPAFELPLVSGQRVKLDAAHARSLIVARLDSVPDAAAAATLAAEAKGIDWADVVVLDGSANDEVTTRARMAMALISELVAGARNAAPLFWIDGNGFVDFIAGGMTIAQMRECDRNLGLFAAGDRQRALVALPRAEREAHLPNVALAALTKLEEAGERGLDLEFGLGLVETRKSAEAAAHFEKVAKDSSDYPRAQLELGRCIARTNHPADARAAFERAVDAAPADAVARFELGRFLLSLKEPDREQAKALGEAGTESLRVATYLKPEFADAQYAFGQGLARVGRHDEAIAALERALALAPDSAQAKPARELLDSLKKRKGP